MEMRYCWGLSCCNLSPVAEGDSFSGNGVECVWSVCAYHTHSVHETFLVRLLIAVNVAFTLYWVAVIKKVLEIRISVGLLY